MFPDSIGWLASFVLLTPLVRQMWARLRSGSVQAVSRWLFIGQMTASVLFLVCGPALHNTLFVVSNAAIPLAAVASQMAFIVTSRRRKYSVRDTRWHAKRIRRAIGN